MKKRTISAFIAIVMLITAIPIDVTADTADEFVIDQNGVLTRYNGVGGDVVIPDGVTSIHWGAFPDAIRPAIISLTFPASVRLIDITYFRGHENAGVLNRGYYNLTDFHVNADNEVYSSVDGVLFSKDQTILHAYPMGKPWSSYTIPDGAVGIGRCAFRDTVFLEKVIIPEGVVRIEDYAFRSCRNLTEIILPNSLRHIGGVAFGSNRMTEIIIPDGVTTIGMSAFAYCARLEKITIPDSVTSLGAHAFMNCISLTEVTIGSGINVIESWMFSGCISLKEIVIPDNITNIGHNAFKDCTGLEEITIGSGVTSLSSSMFWNCTNLTRINFGINGSSVVNVDEGLKQLLWYNNHPDGPVYIGDILFAYKGDMPENTKIEVAEGTVKIASSAFNGHKNLTGITIPDSVTGIEYAAFYGCTGLTTITIPDSVTFIGDYAFARSGLVSITIPDNVKYLGYWAFEKCADLTAIAIGSGVTTINEHTFTNCNNLTTVTFSDGLQSIENGAFFNCESLTGIIFPNTLERIHRDAFRNCTSLTEITIPVSVIRVGNDSFKGATGLTAVYFQSEYPPAFGYDPFDSTNKNLMVYVPKGSLERYRHHLGYYKEKHRWGSPVKANYNYNIIEHDLSPEPTFKSLPNFIAPIKSISPVDKATWVAISDREELENIAKNPQGRYYLTNDIDLSDKEWIPLTFGGIFDGQGHVIRDMTITADNTVQCGLFGQMSGIVKNVGLENVNINVRIRSIGDFGQIGGIAGTASGNSYETINNCYVTGNITVSGANYYPPTAGGIAGNSRSASITNCYNNADVTNDGSTVGGIVGTAWDTSIIVNCYNTGNITTTNNRTGFGSARITGGIVGSVPAHSTLTVTNCYNTGKLSHPASTDTIVGSVITSNRGVADIRTSYWYVDGVGGMIDNNGNLTTPLTTAQMQIASSFVGFDFENVWKIIEGTNGGMPVLQVFEMTDTPDCICGKCEICKPSHNCDVCQDLPNAGKLGHVLGQENITISDALEILKYIVHLSNTIEVCSKSRTAATITGGPIGTADALEILKFIVGIESKLG